MPAHNVLRIYLDRVLPPGRVRADVVDVAFGALRDTAALVGVFASLSAEELEQVLERLEDYEHEFPVPSAGVVASLYDLIPRLRVGRTGMFDFGAELRVDRVALRLLRRIEEPQARTTIVESALRAIETLTGKLRLARLVGHEENVGNELIPVEDAAALEGELRAQILSESPDKLASERDPHLLLGWTAQTGSDDEKARVSELLHVDSLLVAVLTASLSEGFRSELGKVTQTRLYDIPWKWLESLVGDGSLPDLVRSLSARATETQSERERTAIVVALEYADGSRRASDVAD